MTKKLKHIIGGRRRKTNKNKDKLPIAIATPIYENNKIPDEPTIIFNRSPATKTVPTPATESRPPPPPDISPVPGPVPTPEPALASVPLPTPEPALASVPLPTPEPALASVPASVPVKTTALDDKTPAVLNNNNYENEYKLSLKVSPSTVKSDNKDVTIGDIKIVYDSNHRINSTPDQVDYYLMELARYLKWLTTQGLQDNTGSVNDFLKSEEKSISFIKSVSVAPVAGGSRVKRTKLRRARKNVTKKRK